VQSPVEAPDAARQPTEHRPQLPSLGWALRRTALLLAIVAVMVSLGAWLFYASIDFNEASAAGTQPAVESTGSR
jgi:hypothetical protein